MSVGELYKYAITTTSGKILFKADPYAFSAEYRPGTASVTADINNFKWSDEKSMTARSSMVPEERLSAFMKFTLDPGERKTVRKKTDIIHIKRLPRN